MWSRQNCSRRLDVVAVALTAPVQVALITVAELGLASVVVVVLEGVGHRTPCEATLEPLLAVVLVAVAIEWVVLGRQTPLEPQTTVALPAVVVGDGLELAEQLLLLIPLAD